MKKSNAWVVIPAYNEEKDIAHIIKETKKYINKVVVVDDGSKDNTYKTAKDNGAIVLRQIINLGKGASLKTGCDFVINKKAKVIIVLDADAQHNPEEIPKFLESIKNNDIVFGYRKLNKNMPLILKFGNWFINKIINLLWGVDMKDSQCGYRAFTNKAYKKIRWNSSDYSMESEMIAKTGRCNLKYTQILIQTIYPNKYKGTTILDGIKIVLNMFLWRIIKNG